MAIQINLRVDEGLRAKLVDSAQAHGVSVNKEINDRLTRSFADDQFLSANQNDRTLLAILHLVGASMSAAGQATAFVATSSMKGAENWISDPTAFAQATEAAKKVLADTKPQGEPLTELRIDVSKFGIEFADTILEEAATGNWRSSDTSERAKMLHEAVGEKLAAQLREIPRGALMLSVDVGADAKAWARLSMPTKLE
jgi:hypothetical protein